MTPDQFVSKWQSTTLSEKASAHEHFIDLCNLIGHPTPASDPTGQDYTFEKPVHPTLAASKSSKGDQCSGRCPVSLRRALLPRRWGGYSVDKKHP